MKRVLLSAACLLAVISACNKNDVVADKVLDDYSDAPWAVDPSLRVPIQLNMGDLFDVKTTKAAINSLDNVRLGILAVDLVNTADWSELLKDKIAVVDGSGMTQFISADGAPLTYYYPLETPTLHNYAFYGYRTSNETGQEAFNLNDGYTKDVEIGYTDVLWAKSEAEELVNPETPSEKLTGFNADYIRKARVWYSGSWMQYAPTLRFLHLTTALHFNAVAETSEAADSFKDEDNNPLVTISNIVVSGVYTSAELDVISGDLTATESVKGELTVLPDTPVMPTYNQNDDNVNVGTECGTGLFILPTEDPIYVNFTITMPDAIAGSREYRRAEPYLITPPSGGFVAGKAYRFRIIVKDLVTVQAKLELEDWDWTGNNDDVITTIG